MTVQQLEIPKVLTDAGYPVLAVYKTKGMTLVFLGTPNRITGWQSALEFQHSEYERLLTDEAFRNEVLKSHPPRLPKPPIPGPE